MAGHSKFKNIMHRKGAQDAKRAKVFTKVSKEIAVAAQAGKDPAFNPRLRAALIKARAAGLPKDRVEKAIHNDTEGNEYVAYGAYGPGGVGIMTECLTNNKKRVADEIRMVLTKHGGKMQSVDHMFEYIGCLEFRKEDSDRAIEVMIEVPTHEIRELDDVTQVFVLRDHFEEARNLLHQHYINLSYDGMYWLPTLPVDTLEEDDLNKLMNVVYALRDNDDVQEVWTTYTPMILVQDED
jgi:YebC/PmpR family DNA-binding regulatory protein